MAAVSTMEFALSPANLNITASVDLKEGNSTNNATGGYAGLAHGNTPTPGLTNQLIQTDQPFSAEINWTENGSFVPFLGGGTWHIDLIFEKMGGGESAYNPNATQVSTGTSGASYNAVVNVPANTLTEGLYRIVVRMQWHFAGGNPGPLVMFSDLGLIQIYKDN